MATCCYLDYFFSFANFTRFCLQIGLKKYFYIICHSGRLASSNGDVPRALRKCLLGHVWCSGALHFGPTGQRSGVGLVCEQDLALRARIRPWGLLSSPPCPKLWDWSLGAQCHQRSLVIGLWGACHHPLPPSTLRLGPRGLVLSPSGPPHRDWALEPGHLRLTTHTGIRCPIWFSGLGASHGCGNLVTGEQCHQSPTTKFLDP